MDSKIGTTGISKDSLFNGELTCYQSGKGYRFSIDAVILAHFCCYWKKATILDLGCGCGILGLILFYRNSNNITEILGLEYQSSLAHLAKKNVMCNGMEKKIKIRHGDYTKISTLIAAESYSHVICNPPFYKVGSGRPNINEEAYLARHQVAATTADLARAIRFALKHKGVATLIYPADFLAELLEHLCSHGIEPKVMQTVYSYPEANHATLVLIECVKNGGVGLKINRPLFLYQKKNGAYSKEIESMYLSNQYLQSKKC